MRFQNLWHLDLIRAESRDLRFYGLVTGNV